MRTLKKSLSLVLALVFILGLCTIGTNATYAQKYTDAADVTYKDAVDVLTGLGVIEGYKEGETFSFKPVGDVTRAEACAMIARMMLGPETANKLPIGDVKFDDVGEKSWCAQYIAFCYNRGIVKGDGNGKFRPNDLVKGTELAAMLLRALGYGAIGEYEGKGWDINSVADALYYGIFADTLVTDFNKPATREETALYCWNTMWIQLVGWDVDLNYYSGKITTKIDEWGDYWEDIVWMPVTFAYEAFRLVELSYRSQTEPATYVVLENKATGCDYVHLGIHVDGEFYEGLYLDYESDLNNDLNIIGHEVSVYIKGVPKQDKYNHEEYYEAYLIRDESTTLKPFTDFSNYDGLYRALKAANRKNVNVAFIDVPVWTNCDWENAEWLGYLVDWNDFHLYNTVEDLKGQKSGSDGLAWLTAWGTAYGTWVLDHAGMILDLQRTAYNVGRVTAIDDDHEEVEIEVFYRDPMPHAKEDNYTKDELVNFYWERRTGEKINQIYDGIAKDDYVVVQPVGRLLYVKPTDTVELDITSRSSGINLLDFGTAWTFNGMGADTYGDEIYIEDQDDPADVGVGDKVKFYIIKGATVGAFSDTYFGLQILERAKSEGIVYVNYVAEAIDHGAWDKTGEISYVYNVQCINQDGEEVVYQLRHRYEEDGITVNAEDKAAFEALQAQQGNVFEVRVRGKYASFDSNPKNAGAFVKAVGKNTYLKSDGDTYYLTDDTKVIYFKGQGKTLSIDDISHTLTDNASKTEFNVYGVYKKSGGNYKLSVLWVPGQKAPEDYGDSYMFIKGDWASPTGYELFNDDEDAYYTAYIDGVKTSVHINSDYSIFYGDYVAGGFYKFNLDENGVYWLKKVDKKVYDYSFQTRVLDDTSIVKDGSKYYLYVDEIDADHKGSDKAALKCEILDIASKTTIGTKRDTNINDFETLSKFLHEGYLVEVAYMYSVNSSTGNETPTGVMYVINVTPPVA